MDDFEKYDPEYPIKKMIEDISSTANSPTYQKVSEAIQNDTLKQMEKIDAIVDTMELKIYHRDHKTHPHPSIIKDYIMSVIYEYNSAIFEDPELEYKEMVKMIMPPIAYRLIKAAVAKACEDWDARSIDDIELER